MRHVAGEALIGAPRDEVWQLLDDLEGMPRWLPGVDAVSVSGPAHVGTLFRTRRSLLGMERGRDWEIVEHKPTHRQVRASADGSLERRLVLTLDGRGSGTRLHAVLELRSTLPFPIGGLHEVVAALASTAMPGAFAGAVKRAFEGRPR